MFVEYELLDGHSVKAYNDHNEAYEEASKQNLKLAEYGDVYGTKVAYAYWNKSGNRNDDEDIIAYYTFNKEGKPIPISEEELRQRVFN